MKLKKLFAGIVAAAMMLTMGATAFAAGTVADEGNVVENGGSFILTKKLTTVDNVTVPNDEVNFTVTAKSDNAKAEDLALPTINNGQAISVVDGKAEFNVGLPKYTKVGEYIYEIKEKAGNAAGVTYSDATYEMHVYVVNSNPNATEGSVLQCQIRIDKLTTKEDGSQARERKVDKVENTYRAGTLEVSKKVTGSLGDRDQTFDFTVTFKTKTGKVLKSVITVGGTATEITTGTGATYTPAAGDQNATITFDENVTEATVRFKLTDSDSITFTNIPDDVEYIVSETKFDGYTTTINGESVEAKENEITTNGTMAVKTASKVIVAYVNNNGAAVDTGVILDNAPYIALLTIVAFGAVALVLNKRRRDEE